MVTAFKDGSGSVGVRTVFRYEIPYAAQDVIPVIKAALEDNSAELRDLSISSYERKGDEIIDDTVSTWQSCDYETGTYVSI